MSNTKLLALIKLIRYRQWVKNFFVLAPLIFSGKFSSLAAILQGFVAFFLFCIASSATYILNDINDIEQDKLHPKKSKERPLASGQISIKEASILLVVLYLLLIGSAFILEVPMLSVVIGSYILLNFAYTFFLKHQPVVDIFTIAIGFVLRVLAGLVALQLPLSGWMLVTTLCLALYLAAIKRRQELKFNGDQGRKVLEKYSVGLAEHYAHISMTGALVFYSLFVVTEKPQLLITIPFVLFGLFRYWYVVEQLKGGESPTDALLGDLPLLMATLLWVILCCWIYLN